MAFESYEAVGNREDVVDEIYDIAPADNPVAAMSQTTGAINRLHQWQEDDRINDDEHGVGVGDMSGNKGVVSDLPTHTGNLILGLNNKVRITGRYRRDKLDEKRKENEHVADTNRIKKKMRKCCAPCGQISADCCKVGSNSRADIFAENKGNTCFK